MSGLPVTFHSYRPAGTVGDVSTTAFELIRPHGERLWLPYDVVFDVNRRVRLICEQAGLARLSVERPVA